MTHQTITVKAVSPATPRSGAVHRVLADQIANRSGLPVEETDDPSATIRLGIRPDIGAEGFRIEGEPGQPVAITGHDERGLLYGIGKLLRTARLEPGRFEPGTWRGTSVPGKPVRGMYFATHFHNWYHDAPIADIERYVEELALWGCNAISVWFDMHHFTGIDDPAAQAMIERLRAIIAAANRVGIAGSLTSLANEAYAGSPESLRADWRAGQNGYHHAPGGHYHVEICPSRPGGMDLILKWREDMLAAFAGLDIGYFWIWPYDQGGCTCAHCAPWGVNGYLRTAPRVAALARQRFPSARIVLSTWYFDRFVDGEWAGLDARFREQKPGWLDYLLIDDFAGFPEYPLRHGVPGGFPAVGFPEISMEGMHPWGGLGANPRPRYWQGHLLKTRDLLSGGFPYSEGIYEDLNKVLMLQGWWDSRRAAGDIVREYAAAHLAQEAADDLVAAAGLMEDDLPFSARLAENGLTYRCGPLEHAETCLERVNAIARRLPQPLAGSWRWRLLWLRAALDAELKRNGGRPSDTCDAFLRELIRIYCADHAEGHVRPPARDLRETRT